MASEPIPGQGKRRRRRRRRGGGGNSVAPTAPNRQAEDESGKAFPDPKASSRVDFDLVAAECLQARHREVFEWMKRALGKSSQELITEMVRGAVIKENAAYREARGIVSGSTQNLAALLNR